MNINANKILKTVETVREREREREPQFREINFIYYAKNKLNKNIKRVGYRKSKV